jgi:hypothetical protein
MANLEVWQGIVRHVLTAVGGYLTAAGYTDDAMVQAGIGAVLTLFGIAWSVSAKKKATA